MYFEQKFKYPVIKYMIHCFWIQNKQNIQKTPIAIKVKAIWKPNKTEEQENAHHKYCCFWICQ